MAVKLTRLTHRIAIQLHLVAVIASGSQLGKFGYALAYVLVGKPEGKRPLGRPRCRWEDNIRLDLREREWESVDWIRLAQVRD
jgi:hypothetical protein